MSLGMQDGDCLGDASNHRALHHASSPPPETPLDHGTRNSTTTDTGVSRPFDTPPLLFPSFLDTETRTWPLWFPTPVPGAAYTSTPASQPAYAHDGLPLVFFHGFEDHELSPASVTANLALQHASHGGSHGDYHSNGAMRHWPGSLERAPVHPSLMAPSLTRSRSKSYDGAQPGHEHASFFPYTEHTPPRWATTPHSATTASSSAEFGYGPQSHSFPQPGHTFPDWAMTHGIGTPSQGPTTDPQTFLPTLLQTPTLTRTSAQAGAASRFHTLPGSRRGSLPGTHARPALPFGNAAGNPFLTTSPRLHASSMSGGPMRTTASGLSSHARGTSPLPFSTADTYAPYAASAPAAPSTSAAAAAAAAAAATVSNSTVQAHRQSLKGWTLQDDLLIIELKQGRSYSWSQIQRFFPGKRASAIQVHYSRHLSKLTADEIDRMKERDAQVKQAEIKSRWHETAWGWRSQMGQEGGASSFAFAHEQEHAHAQGDHEDEEGQGHEVMLQPPGAAHMADDQDQDQDQEDHEDHGTVHGDEDDINTKTRSLM